MNDSIHTQIESLNTLRLPELQARFAEVLGEATRSPNKTFLIRRITEGLEAQATEAAAAEAEVTENDAETAIPVEAAPPARDADPVVQPPDEGDTTSAADAVVTQIDADAAITAAPSDGDESRLSKLSLEGLQARYLEVVGRPTSSSNVRYLVWKIREAQRGRVPVGPRSRSRADGNKVDFKILPLRMEAELVEQLDDARARLGLRTRMDLFRRALHTYLLGAGEADVAALFASEA